MKHPEDYELLTTLCRIPSQTPDIAANDQAQDVLERWLRERGVRTVFERGPDGRKILFAATHPGKVQDYLLNAHTDVVAAPPELFEPVERDGWLYGRGTGDCKGQVVTIARLLVDLNGRASVGAIFSSDEELGGFSAETMVNLGYGATKLVIVLDSQPGKVCTGEKGHTYFTLRANGVSCHSSRPWEGDNPVTRLLSAWAKLEAILPRSATEQDQWHDTLEPTLLKAGDVPNRIPECAELTLNLRYTEPGGSDFWEARIRETTGLEVVRGEESLPVTMDPDTPIIRRFHEHFRRSFPNRDVPLVRTNGATDARHFVKLGVPIVISAALKRGDHGLNEAVCLSSIDEYVDVLSRFLNGEGLE